MSGQAGLPGPRQRATTMTALLTWTFKVQCAHLNMAAALDDFSPDWRGESGDGVAFLMRTGGVIVDGGGGFGRGGGLPSDALDLFILCEKLLSADEWLLVLWAALAERPPDWGAAVPPIRCAPVFRCHPIYGNQVSVHTRGPGRGKSGRGIQYCPVQYLDQAAERDRRRGRYRAWFLALMRLTHECRARPERFRDWYVESPGAPAAPWENGALREIA